MPNTPASEETDRPGAIPLHGKPYYSLDAWCKNTYGYKCYKIALNAHMTCPNRDGTCGTRGCIFCSAGGSGDFAVDTADKSVDEQLCEGVRALHGKLGDASDPTRPNLIAYFQAYTNTYAPTGYLEKVYSEALSHPRVLGISIATRPDCLPVEVLDLIDALKLRYPGKFIWVELGLQTIHEKSAEYIRRGYALPVFEDAYFRLKARDIPVIVHLILGLPGETAEQIYESVRYVDARKPFGVKLQLLHVLRGTDLADHYLAGEFKTLTREAYLTLLADCLELLSPDIVVHRVTGDGSKKDLIAPTWSSHKKDVLNALHRLMRERKSHAAGPHNAL